MASSKDFQALLYNLPYTQRMPLSQVFDFLGRLSEVTGLIVKHSSEPKSAISARVFRCPDCKNEVIVNREQSSRSEVEEAPCCSSSLPTTSTLNRVSVPCQSDLEKIRDEYTDYQEVLVCSGKYELLIVLEGNLVNCLKPGVCLSATGVLYLRWVCDPSVSLVQDYAFKVIGLRPEIYQGIRSGLEPLLQYFHEADEFNRRIVILRSFFSSVYAHYHIKLGLILAIVSHIMGKPASVMLIGDTATGKSLVLKSLAKNCEEITSYISCLPSTPINLCPSKINLVDNFHLLNKKKEIYRTIEQSSVIAAATSFSKDLIKEKIVRTSRKEFGEMRCKTDLLSANLDRFDLILKAGSYDDSPEYLKAKLDGASMEDLQGLWMPETIKEFLMMGKAEPDLADPGVGLILEKVHDVVRSAQLKLSAMPSGVSVRLLESVIKLSKAHAALMQRSQVKIFDVVSVILLTTNAGSDDSLSSSNCFVDPGDFDLETRHFLELLR
eukprot:CAMPEP_0204912320 /NCGR_PEP_ID=MMETSP1397-20131031/10487_1 /ASSEMBLY_ACC=CAM_ASM_000891 /TAXON_ID=49980 /ORGANISM="Climacostomum Climacostomum virens, Strain Stock W-24" /LENGTH=493 /DNA_ID=CAMNT_0052083223 /DNA_START=175 /DNA_END=1656 /DNA_ORIENTATION=+